MWIYAYRKKNCPVLWELFSSAFLYKSPCNVTSEDYERFALKAKHPPPRDKVTNMAFLSYF